MVYLIDGLLQYYVNDAFLGRGWWEGTGKCIAMAPVGTQKFRASFGRGLVGQDGWGVLGVSDIMYFLL